VITKRISNQFNFMNCPCEKICIVIASQHPNFVSIFVTLEVVKILSKKYVVKINHKIKSSIIIKYSSRTLIIILIYKIYSRDELILNQAMNCLKKNIKLTHQDCTFCRRSTSTPPILAVVLVM
jgi:hypothetical protein